MQPNDQIIIDLIDAKYNFILNGWIPNDYNLSFIISKIKTVANGQKNSYDYNVFLTHLKHIIKRSYVDTKISFLFYDAHYHCEDILKFCSRYVRETNRPPNFIKRTDREIINNLNKILNQK